MQNKPEFIATIAELGEITKGEAEYILDLVIASLQSAIQTDGGVKLNGVGEVAVADKKASSGVIDGRAWSKPASKTIKAKVSKVFVANTLEQ